MNDSETGEEVMVNTSDPAFRSKYEQLMFSRKMELDRMFKVVRLQPIVLDTSESIQEPLLHYFRLRSSRF